MAIPKINTFLSNAAIYGVGGVLLQAAGLILLPLYTTYLTPGEYGIIEIIERIGGIIHIVLMAGGIRQAALAFYLKAENDEQRDPVAVTISLFVICIFVLSGIIISLGSPILAYVLDINDKNIVIFGVIAVVSELFLLIPLALIQARVESILFVMVSFGVMVVRVGLAVLFVGVLGYGIWGVYLALLLTFTGFGLILTIRELMKGSLIVDWVKFRKIVDFSLPFIPTGICYFFLYNGDRFFLVSYWGKEAVGIYAVGCKIAACAGMVSTIPMFAVWSAKMYEVFKRPDASIVVGKMMTYIIILYSFFGVGLSFFSDEILAVLSEETFSDAGKIIAPIVIANAFLFCSNFMEGALYVYDRTALKPKIALIGTLLIFIFYAILIPKYSYHGAALATVMGYFAIAVVSFKIVGTVFEVRYEFSKLLLLMLINIAFVMLSRYLPVSVIGAFCKAALLIFWLLLVWHSKVLDTGDKSRIINEVCRVKEKIQSFI